MGADKAGSGKSLMSDDTSRELLAAIARVTGGMSPQALGGAWWNVMSRLALAPGRQAQLAQTAIQKAIALAQFTGGALKPQGEPVGPAGCRHTIRKPLRRSGVGEVSVQRAGTVVHHCLRVGS